MLSYDGHLRNESVAIHLILLSSTATSSATGGYVVVPKRPSRNEEKTRNAPSSYLVSPQNLFSE